MTDGTKVEADIVVVFGWEGKKKELVLSAEAAQVNQVLGGMLSEVAGIEDFEGKPGNELLIHTHKKIPSSRVLLAGLGNPKEVSVYDWQVASARIGRAAKKVGAGRVAFTLPAEIIGQLGTQKTAEGVVCGIRLGTYTFIKHKSIDEQEKEKHIDEVLLLTSPNKLDEVSDGLGKGQMMADAVIFARDLVNEPPSTTTPTYLAHVAKNLAKKYASITCEALGPKDMEKLGMGALLGVARGSDEEPRFIHLAYDGGGRKTVALLGKGITFDTGGLSLKDANNMETMKMDMAGAAAILAVFSVLPVLQPKQKIVGLICATENMPGSGAVKPGDIVRAMNGKSIEILNTDAEGRVVLADALSYAADKVKPDVMIDVATLTGACMVALGEEVAGLFANKPELAEALKKSALASGERIWELPLVKEYRELLKSSVADVRNISKIRYGGAITGALFLSEFVPDTISWAHLDIAGPAFAEKDAPLTPLGATGYGVRMILSYLLSLK